MADRLFTFGLGRLNLHWGEYRPALDRLTFAFALVGCIVVVHLGLQQARGFEAGCFGVAALNPGGASFDCAAVVASAAGTFLGVSNIDWGMLFYGLVALLSYAAFITSAWRRSVKQVRAALIGAGVIYSGYLMYFQFTQLDALCPLCLVSAGIVAVLAVLQVASLISTNRSTPAAMSTETSKREFTLLTYLLALAGLVIGADVYFSSQPAQAASSSPAVAQAVAPDTTQVAEGCYYDPEKSPVQNFGSLVDFQDPSQGNADAPVTIVEYFDPNCPHCKTMHAVMKQAVEQYSDEAQFVYKPMPLWQYSVPQIEALYAAAQEGKFIPMLEAQYARQQRGGLSMQQMKAIAQEIDMNPDVLESRVQQQTYRQRIMQQRQKAVQIGVDSTPTVIINGRFVASESRTLRCLGAFIDAAAQNATSSASG